jgi:arginyl-tRNA synthetase
MNDRPPFRDHVAARVAAAASVDAMRVRDALEIPPDPRLGEFALPCFLLARERRQPPPKIAAEIASSLGPDDVIESAAAAGPYVNFRLRTAALARGVLEPLLARGPAYASSGMTGTVVVDYSSPNIAKPLSIGHLRSTVLGNALVRIMKHVGMRVVGINHLGDWGTQFGFLLTGWRRWGSEDALARDGIGHLVELYVQANKSEDPTIRESARAAFKALEDGDPVALALWRRFREISLSEFHRFYEEMGVAFDSEDGEAFFNDRMEPALALLAGRGLTELSDGALVVPMGADRKPALLKKSDGATLYLTRDLAAALHRIEAYRPDRLLYVVGAPQKDHFRELFAILEKLDPANRDRFVHVDFGAYRLADAKMGTRHGNVVFLSDVFARGTEIARAKIEQKNPDLPDKERVARRVALGAVVFGDLVNDRTKDIVFEWEKVLDFDGDTAPYVMFAHVRACGILRKLAEEGLTPERARLAPDVLGHEHERRLLAQLSAFRDVLESVARTLKPHILAGYLLEVARVYHRFCHDCPVLKAEPALQGSRLLLTRGVATVLSTGLTLLGVDAPERM